MSSVRHSCPYPKLLLKFCTPVPQYPGYYDTRTPNRFKFKFCKTSVPVPETCVSSVRLAPYPGYGYTFATISGEPVPIWVLPGMLRILTSCLVSHTPKTKKKVHLFMFFSFLSETAVLATAVLQISVGLFLVVSFVSGTLQYVTCFFCMYKYYKVNTRQL